MSDIEDGELLSSDNEDYDQPPSKEEKIEKSKHKDKNHIDTNNNQHNNDNEQRNFHKNDDNRHNKKKNSSSPRSHNNERKRSHYKIESNDNIKQRKSLKSECKEREYFPPIKKEAINELKIDNQSFLETNQTKRRILCKYYAGGECKNGTTCVFMHEDFPCKFFHDKSSICRAGNDCKYSHSPLSDDMQVVMDCFIQEGKEHKPTFSAPSALPSYNTTTTVHSRTKCLLPTPVMINPDPNINQQPFNETNNFNTFNEFQEEDSFVQHLPTFNENNSTTYRSRFSDPIVRVPHPPNKSKFPPHEFRPKLSTNNFPKTQSEIYAKNYFHSSANSNCLTYPENSIHDNYKSNFFTTKSEPMAPNEINISEPPPSCDIRGNHQIATTQNTSYNNHAPARFIIGANLNHHNNSKIVENHFDYEFKEALKKLASQVVLEIPEMPLSPEKNNDEFDEISPKDEMKPNYLLGTYPMKQEKTIDEPIKDEQLVIKQEKIEIPTVRIAENTSIFNINENELSESEKQYIDEMKSLINLDAQFENIIPWSAIKLDSVTKQPYILFSLKVDNVHENAASDPRLIGHPVLRAIENQNDPDEATPIQNSHNHYNNNNNNYNNSNDDDVDSDDNNNNNQLNIDLTLPNQTSTGCETRSYLYDCKFKRKKISGSIML